MTCFVRSLAVGVENAVVICCFMTPDYEKSENCKFEVQYAQKRGKSLIPCILGDVSPWKPTAWLESITREHEPIDFYDDCESNIYLKTDELVNRIYEQCMSTPYLASQSVDNVSYFFELIKREYKRNSRIERFVNPAKSFPIEDSYINLAIVETKEQREKEKQIRDANHHDKIINTFEQIYDTKTPIDVKDIFKYCEDQLRQVLVFGRAGVGKTTFCRYVAHQWAQGKLWPEYDLVVLFSLRLLTKIRYPSLSSGSYSLLDVVEREYFPDGLCEKAKEILKNQLNRFKVLWIFDGYDELVHNVPSHLQGLLQEQMLKTPHHIITSRPYSNTLSYKVQMEITGFTNENIQKYAAQFFDHIKEELDDASSQAQKCLEFLKVNSQIWGIAHIPVNLELICSIWGDTDWQETENMTMTALYDNITEWLCRRYLIKQNSTQTTQEHDHEGCDKALEFLEKLAFIAIVSNTVLIRKELLQKAMKETQCSLRTNPQILGIGILKSYDSGATGSRFELDKHHYFVHLSFQEYFAARYVCKALKDPADQRVIKLIQTDKYDRRFSLMLTFASGLLTNADDCASLNRFWDLIHTKHRDLIGFRHLQLLIPCIDEGRCSASIETKDKIIHYIINWIQYILSLKIEALQKKLRGLLRTCASLAEQSAIQNNLLRQLRTNNPTIQKAVLLLISEMASPGSSAELFSFVSGHFADQNSALRGTALTALAKLGEKTATRDVVSRLVISLGDSETDVRRSACQSLETLGKKAATSEVIGRLVMSLGDSDRNVRLSACEVLGRFGKKAATSEVISRLVISLEDSNTYIRLSAYEALGSFGEKAVTSEVISRLVISLGDSDKNVRLRACEALGRLGEKAATNEVISRLAIILVDSDANVRSSACKALGKLGEKAATSEIISRLVISLGDRDTYVRLSTCEILGRLGEKAATNEVISRLAITLGDSDRSVRLSACEVLGRLR